MSRREPIVRATISALQPKGLDLTRYRRQAAGERRINLRPEDAAGAMAYSSCDIEVNGEVVLGDSLRPRLLRLKAFPDDRESFDAAMTLLLERNGFKATKPEAVLYAVVFVALFEWLHDACPKCRKERRGSPQPRLCLDCGQRREEVTQRGLDGKERVVRVLMGQPTPGCNKCRGLGRIFPKDDGSRGMVCRTCGNSGRVFFKSSMRETLVAEFYRDQMRRDLDHEAYRRVWIKRHRQVLDDLRTIDAALVGGMDVRDRSTRSEIPRAAEFLDTNVSPSDNARTMPEPHEPVVDTAEDEPEREQIAPGLAPE